MKPGTLHHKLICVAVYVGCGASFSILIKKSQGKNGEFSYDPVSVTLAVEFLKLILACIIYFSWNDGLTVKEKWNELKSKWRFALLFSIPASMYGIYNALTFYAIQYVGPGPYRLLINMKVLSSGVILSMMGMKILSRWQWFSLGLLVVACFIERWDSFMFENLGFWALGIVFIQCICSSMAGVVNQRLLSTTSKGDCEDKRNRDTWQRNVMMYVWTCSLNCIWLAISSPHVFAWKSVEQCFSLQLFPLILSSTFIGFATSLLLSFYDVILKEYANFIELVLTVVAACIFFGSPLKMNLLVAVFIAGYSLIEYTKEEQRLGRMHKQEMAASAGSGSDGTSIATELVELESVDVDNGAAEQRTHVARRV